MESAHVVHIDFSATLNTDSGVAPQRTWDFTFSATRTGLRGRSAHQLVTKVDLGFCQNGTSHGLLGEAVRESAAQPTRWGHPRFLARFLAAVSAQTADFNGVRSPNNPAILGLMRLNFLSVGKP